MNLVPSAAAFSPSAVEGVLHETTSLCRVCKNAVPARVVVRGRAAWLVKTCAAHGPQEVEICDDAQWYARTRAVAPKLSGPRRVVRTIEHGCPFDCGACASHTQRVRLPVVTITSACNLDCPICYVHNKNEGAFHMGADEVKAILTHLKAEGGDDLDIINFTGGEPTLHPHFLDFVTLAHEAGIHRVSVCSNGLRLAKDEALVKRLGELRARIALAFDTFDPVADFALQGAHLVETKLRCVEMCERHGVDVTLIPVMTKGLNDTEIGRLLDYAFHKTCVRHVEVHLMTYTGQGGVGFSRSGRICLHEVLARIEETTAGLLTAQDFVSSPCAHPLCYQIAYLLIDPEGGPPIPFTRFLSRDTLYECLGERLYLEPSRRLEEAFRDAIDRLWSEGGPQAARTLSLLQRLLKDLAPVGRTLSRDEALRVSERAMKAVYIHAHMDEETFDVERLPLCCDSNCYADGSTIPVCAYNVLYREKEQRFMTSPRSWSERSGGQLPPLPDAGRGPGRGV